MKLSFLPAFFIFAVFFYMPILFILFYSFSTRNLDSLSAVQFFPPTLINYKNILNPLYFNVYIETVWIVCLTAIIMLVLAYSVAFFITSLPATLKKIFLFCLIIPSFVGFITKIYALFICFRPNGTLFPFLAKLNLLGSSGIVILGLLSIYLPFMTLPIFFDLDKIEKNLLQAATNLGATPWQILYKILWPLSRRGVATGLMASIPMFGEMAVIKMLGGDKTPFLGVLIGDTFMGGASPNWPFAAALTVCLILTTSMSIFLLSRLQRRES